MSRSPSVAPGLGLALTSAATFSTSGTFASSLLDAGWSPTAAVSARIGVAAAVLTPPALAGLRGRWHLLRASAGVLAVYGLLAVVAGQLFYFQAVERIGVGVSLMLEYLGSVLVVAWMWLRHAQRPGSRTLAGAGIALTGLALVLVVTGPVRLDPAGVLWGLGAAVGGAAYFVLSARTDGLPPLVTAWAGLVVGAAVLGVAAAVGAAPLRATRADVVLAGHRTGWPVPVLGLALVAAVVPYVTGIRASRVLGPRLASFVGMSEVVFAVLVAWVVLGQLPAPGQLAGGVVILTGVALVRAAEGPVAVPEERPVPVG